MQIHLLRHARTLGNIAGRYNGKSDDDLSPEGVAYAKTCLYPEQSLVYVSPLSRARKTAGILFPDAEQLVVPELAEMDFGDFEGHTADELANDARYRAWVDADCVPPTPNGESISGFAERAASAFDHVVNDAAGRRLQDVAILAHGGTCMAVMSRYAVDPEREHYYDWIVGNCSGYLLELDGDAWAGGHELKSWQTIDGQDWRGHRHSFFQHKDCEYFPCHEALPEEDFNCLFCYCPLYSSGKECGGGFSYTESGIKSCIGCTRPHARDNYPEMHRLITRLYCQPIKPL